MLCSCNGCTGNGNNVDVWGELSGTKDDRNMEFCDELLDGVDDCNCCILD